MRFLLGALSVAGMLSARESDQPVALPSGMVVPAMKPLFQLAEKTAAEVAPAGSSVAERRRKDVFMADGVMEWSGWKAAG